MTCVSFFVHRWVYVPLRDLETGAKRLSAGNLEEIIPELARRGAGRVRFAAGAFAREAFDVRAV